MTEEIADRNAWRAEEETIAQRPRVVVSSMKTFSQASSKSMLLMSVLKTRTRSTSRLKVPGNDSCDKGQST